MLKKLHNKKLIFFKYLPIIKLEKLHKPNIINI